MFGGSPLLVSTCLPTDEKAVDAVFVVVVVAVVVVVLVLDDEILFIFILKAMHFLGFF